MSALGLEQVGEHARHVRLVIHHQNPDARREHVSPFRFRRLPHRRGDHGKIDGEDGALPQLAVHPDGAAVALDDALAKGQSESGSLAHRLRREERLEDALQDLRRDARPRIRHLQQHPRVGGIESGADAELSGGGAPMHRVVGVGDEVHDHLMELVGIRPELRKVLGQIEVDLDVVDPQRVREQLHRLLNDLIEARELPLEGMLPGQGQKISDDPHASLRGIRDPVDALAGRPVAERLAEDRAVPGHHRERVVQLVRDAGEERPHVRELFALDAGRPLMG